MLETKLHIPTGKEAGRRTEGGTANRETVWQNQAFRPRNVFGPDCSLNPGTQQLCLNARGIAQDPGTACYCVAQIQPLPKANLKRTELHESPDFAPTKEELEEAKIAAYNVSQDIILQYQLSAAQHEIARLRQQLADNSKQRLDLIPVKVHEDMLKTAEDRAEKAELKASLLEEEVKRLKAERSQARTFTPAAMPSITEAPGEEYEEPHPFLLRDAVNPPRTSPRKRGVGFSSSITTSTPRDSRRMPRNQDADEVEILTHGNHIDKTRLQSHRHQNGHANLHVNGQLNGQKARHNNVSFAHTVRGISVMPSVVPQPLPPSLADTHDSERRCPSSNGHCDSRVFSGSQTLGRNFAPSQKAFRKRDGTMNLSGSSTVSNMARLASKPKMRRRPSVHSLVSLSESIVNLDDKCEQELMEELEREEAERAEQERLEKERVEKLNKENKQSKLKGKLKKTVKASTSRATGKSLLSRNKASKSSSPKRSLLSRMQTKFFTSRRKPVRHIYDLPEVSTLETCSLTSDYETPAQKMQSFAATPLIGLTPVRTSRKSRKKPHVYPRVKTLKRRSTRGARSRRRAPPVGNDLEDSEESDWSSSEDGTTTRSAKHKRATTKSRDRHRTNTNKAPPPIAPKPKKHTAQAYRAGSGSSNPPSSPDSNTPDTTPEISFDDIVIESPQLKMYKRIHGPQGRRRPQRYSNQSEIRQSEISLVAENGTP
ncbi:uncharacterized protein [Diadema setosum]|uniref:uncharacterized protein n=1 Tax=Diadema setosum TaxID=31175 RepID=UPI003B3B7A8B